MIIIDDKYDQNKIFVNFGRVRELKYQKCRFLALPHRGVFQKVARSIFRAEEHEKQ